MRTPVAARILATVVLLAAAPSCARVGSGSPASTVSTVAPQAVEEAHNCPDTGPRPGQTNPPARSTERGELTSHVEDLLDPIRLSHGDWIDTLWVEHEPGFRLIIRVAGGIPFHEVCALVVAWPILVALERAAAGYTFGDVEEGAQILNDKWTREDFWTDPTFPFIELGPDPVSNSVLVSGPQRPAQAYLDELAKVAGVPVTWAFMARAPTEIPGKPPECLNPTAMCR
jgi:hypothetical protein